MDRTVDGVGLSVLRHIQDLWAAAKADSYIDYTRVTRVEPICLVDASLVHLPYMTDVMQSMQSIFSGYYLQAFLISTNVGRIEVFRQLDKLNPNRSPSDSAADSAGWMMSIESYKHKLPRATGKLSLEGDRVRETEATAGDRVTNSIADMANLSVGKMLNVEISDGAHRATIPISIRIMASSIPTSSLVHILSVGNKETGTKERLRGWKSGRLEFWRDIVFATDLVDSHAKSLNNDKSGMYAQILARRQKNGLATLFSANPSVATASNLAVISKATADQLEGETGLRLKDFKSRQKVFKETYMMILAVVDSNWERVTFYHRGIETPTEVSIKDLKVSNRDTGPDIGDILKAYQLGNSPSL